MKLQIMHRLLDCLIIWLSIFTLKPEYVFTEDFDDYILRGPKFSASTEEYIEGETLDKNIMALAKRRINYIFIIDAVRNEKLGWNEFIEKSRNLAAKLQEFGCASGCIVGIISENRVEYPIVYLGTWLSGATLNNFDLLSNTDELTRLYGITKPRIIFGPVEHCNRLRTACPKCTFTVFDPDNGTNALPFSTVTQNVKKTLEPVQIQPEDTAFIMYSSGTTGLPKAIRG